MGQLHAQGEVAECEVCCIASQLNVARFFIYKDLTSFNFASGQVTEASKQRGLIQIHSVTAVISASEAR